MNFKLTRGGGRVVAMQKNKYRILVLDGQGGGIGARLIKLISPKLPANWELICVGTNSLATSSMLKAGASQGATGENAVIYNAGRADIIMGPVGVILANGIMGEVSSGMAAAVSGSRAVKILIPSSSCGILIAGSEDCRLEDALARAAVLVQKEISLSTEAPA